MERMMKKIFLMTMVAISLSLVNTQHAYSQVLETIPFTVEAKPELRKAMYKALREDIAPLKEAVGSSPWLSFAFVDLNYDGKDEILVNVQDEYILVDEYGNSYVHGFAQTSKGLIKIFKSPAAEIKLESTYGDGLKKIHVYKRPDIKKSTVFIWDGKKEYIEQKEGDS